ncbi:MAG: hypothetical protein ACREGE_03385 [Candidatus Microsaccharimonas sp.]
MEHLPTNHFERSDAQRREISVEIYDAITTSLVHLQALPGVGPEHSSVIELQEELAIAERALTYFDTENTTAYAA